MVTRSRHGGDALHGDVPSRDAEDVRAGSQVAAMPGLSQLQAFDSIRPSRRWSESTGAKGCRKSVVAAGLAGRKQALPEHRKNNGRPVGMRIRKSGMSTAAS